jgi:hypothetical protein
MISGAAFALVGIIRYMRKMNTYTIVPDNAGGFRVDITIGGDGVDPNPPTFQTEADAKQWVAEQEAETAKSEHGPLRP